MFRRRRGRAEPEPDAPDAGADASTGAGADGGSDAVVDEADPSNRASSRSARPDGPWDVDEVDLDAEENRRGRLDLGGLVLRGRAAVQIRIDVDEKTRRVRSVTFLQEGSALQLQAFAAPRSTGIWADVAQEIAADSTRRGGTATRRSGPYGTELEVVLPVKTSDGRAATQASRIVGIDGPRWMLRASFLGAAVDPERAGDLDAVLRDTVVVRGDDPMAPRDMLPLRIPTGPKVGMAGGVGDDPESEAPARPPLSPFRRGPEITELH